MNESEPCAFVVTRGRYVTERGPCAKWATAWLGDIAVCPTHLRKLQGSLETAIRQGSRSANALEDNAQWFHLAKATIARVEADAKAAAWDTKETARRAASVVYFMERDGFVKIGFSATLTTRRKAISKGSSLIDGMTVGPVRVLATTPGDRDNERFLHTKFASKRVDGEWFLLDDDLWAFITGLKGYTGEPRQDGDRAA